jgi:hypothetical protein
MNCIVVPVYQQFELLDPKEIISLVQLYKVLGRHAIFFIGPEDLHPTPYLQHARLHNVTAGVKNFEKAAFAGLIGYNRMLMSAKFYEAFQEYDYMLIYQTDAFAFKDELQHWCDKGYDFIGAPWFENLHNATASSPLIGVGNGGFSLRKIATFIKGMQKVDRFRRLGGFSRFLAGRKAYSVLFSSVNMQEDEFWTRCMPLFLPGFLVATIDDATKFSFEVRPGDLFEKTQHQLPFGCHAWWRYDLEFWKPFIRSYGHAL